MTQDEKAKAYDEALKRAKEWSSTKNGYYTPEELCKEIFPELKESEDEKIRNTIFDCLYKCCDSGVISREQREKCIAWLEKQDEKKPVEWNEEDEQTIKDVIILIEDGTLSKEGKEYYINKLKALRPRKQWKPSLQQINALSVVVKHGQTDDTKALKELLEQLKVII